jgi:hypothetical protein
MRQVYDAEVEAVKNDQSKFREFTGEVASFRRGEPDENGINRNDFKLMRITVSARDTVYMRLEPNDNADQKVELDLSLYQARWLSTALLAAIAAAEQWLVHKKAENDRAKQRRQAKKNAAKEPLQ